MDDATAELGAAYGLAALCLQMALLNVLAGQGGVPKRQIEALIEKAKIAPTLLADSEVPQAMIDYAKEAIERVGRNWETMQVRH